MKRRERAQVRVQVLWEEELRMMKRRLRRMIFALIGQYVS